MADEGWLMKGGRSTEKIFVSSLSSVRLRKLCFSILFFVFAYSFIGMINHRFLEYMVS